MLGFGDGSPLPRPVFDVHHEAFQPGCREQPGCNFMLGLWLASQRIEAPSQTHPSALACNGLRDVAEADITAMRAIGILELPPQVCDLHIRYVEETGVPLGTGQPDAHE